MSSRVAVVSCPSYEPEAVFEAVKRGLGLLGGAASFASRGERILLKPNLLVGKNPSQAVTTHPAVFEAVIRAFSEVGASLSYGDSPGYGNPKQTAAKAGLAAAAETHGVPFADFDTAMLVPSPGSEDGNIFPIAAGVLEADGVVSLSKMKTHQLTRITGAVKNQFGCIVGFEKANYHLRFPNLRQFSSMLVDLNLVIGPRLHVMDGITAMQGEGPSSGNPVSMGVLLFSRDPVALDSVFCRLVRLDPAFVPTITEGAAKGLGVFAEGEVELLGDCIDDLARPDFDVKREPAEGASTLRAILPLKNQLVCRPEIIEKRCVKCGICVGACPVPGKALDFSGLARTKPPRYDYSRCIRCYCCHEMCPHKAIVVRLPLLGRIVSRLLRRSS